MNFVNDNEMITHPVTCEKKKCGTIRGMKKIKALMIPIILIMLLILHGCGAEDPAASPGPFTYEEETKETAKEPAEADITEESEEESLEAETGELPEDGVYTSKDDVALYIHTYGRLPDNFITKKEARALGWNGGGLDDYAEGMCIGGDHFGNYEGALPDKKGREYRECDINTLHKNSRGPERLVYSDDGLIYYTPDHYESWEMIYDGNE